MTDPTRVVVWNEFRHEKKNATVREIYPDGIHGCLAEALRRAGSDIKVTTATLDEREHGLSAAVLEQTDVLLWWGHVAHDAVDDAVVDGIQRRVLEGMGLIVLHSAHYSKVFRRLMGTSCSLRWREADDRERVWNVEPSHPIAEGIGDFIELPRHEMYGERFDIPAPDELVFLSWFSGGEVFRSGCTWQRGHGKVFYFSPGHETYPIYHNAQVQRVIVNAVRWAKARVRLPQECVKSPAIEPRQTA